jgi:hypothetical protein
MLSPAKSVPTIGSVMSGRGQYDSPETGPP